PRKVLHTNGFRLSVHFYIILPPTLNREKLHASRTYSEQVPTYQLFLVQEKQVACPSVVQTVCALRFFYRVTLGRPAMLEYIAPAGRPCTLPTILSQAEVAAFMSVGVQDLLDDAPERGSRVGFHQVRHAVVEPHGLGLRVQGIPGQ